MSTEQNASMIRAMYDDQWNKHDPGVFERCIAPNHISHQPLEDQFPQGIEGQRIFTETFSTAIPDVHCEVTDQDSEADMVKSWLTFTGTQTGELLGIPPTGRYITVPVVVMDRIANGKVVESWVEWDPSDMMRQLGVA